MEVCQEDVVECASVLDQIQTQRSQTGTSVEDQALFAMSNLE
jgi:hypothetical protein